MPQDNQLDALTPTQCPTFNAPAINHASTFEEVKREDIEIANIALQGVALGWQRVFKIEDICKLALTTMKVLESRRKLLCMQYGAESDKRASGVVEPLDF